MENLIDTARGNIPADLILKNAQVVNVFSGEIIKTDVAVKGPLIAGIGCYHKGDKVLDLKGKYLIPGLIDAHIHIESSLLTPENFAAVVVPHGTTAVIADPHEIVNAAGRAGLDYMFNVSKGLPLEIFYMIPSCVPATGLETSGAVIGPREIEELFRRYPQSPGLAEMMNYPGILYKDTSVLEKVLIAQKMNRAIDGHAPLLSGNDLNAYISAGINTDHECTTLEEAKEKLRLGVSVMIREGSAAQNLRELLPLINSNTWPFLFFCSDDRHAGNLINDGDMDDILRKAISHGLDPVTAVRMATINPARHYRLHNLGAIAPGYQADMVVVNNLKEFTVEKVYKKGRLVASEQKICTSISRYHDIKMHNTVHLPDLTGKLRVSVSDEKSHARVIEVCPDQIVTKNVAVPIREVNTTEDIITVAVIERHGKNGNIALGLVKGFGIKNGALASTVAHDSHNLIVAGDNEKDMELAAKIISDMGGGLAAVSAGKVLAALDLPVAGLMSENDAAAVSSKYEELLEAAKITGCILPSPFMTMSFLALPVIPELKITDRGLVDVGKFNFVDLFF